MNKNEVKRKLSKEELEGLRIVFEETKARAKKEGVGFNITFEDICDSWIENKGECFYTGLPLTLPTKSDPSKGTVAITCFDKDKVLDEIKENERKKGKTKEHRIGEKQGALCIHLLKNPNLTFFAVKQWHDFFVCRCADCIERIDNNDRPSLTEMRIVCRSCLFNHLGKQRIEKAVQALRNRSETK